MYVSTVAMAAFLAVTLALPLAGRAEQAAATICPPMNFPQQNLASNPGFEVSCTLAWVSCSGASCNVPPPSAAAGWTMHTQNGSTISTRCVTPSQVPEKGGPKMLQVRATSPEGGVRQRLRPSNLRTMFSVWVRVQSGQVAIQLQDFSNGPAAWSTKHLEWEQLHRRDGVRR
jgi:hypothetical protein